MLEIMCRDEATARALQEHFGGGNVRRETPRYRSDIVNHVYRVHGHKALDIIERLLP